MTIEEALYAFWDSLDAQERLNWLECYDIKGKFKVMYLPLDEVLTYLGWADRHEFVDCLISEVEGY